MRETKDCKIINEAYKSIWSRKFPNIENQIFGRDAINSITLKQLTSKYNNDAHDWSNEEIISYLEKEFGGKWKKVTGLSNNIPKLSDTWERINIQSQPSFKVGDRVSWKGDGSFIIEFINKEGEIFIREITQNGFIVKASELKKVT